MRALTLAFGFACVAACAQPLAAQHALVTLPLDDPAHVQLRALERLGCAAARVSPFRPYLVGRVREALERARAEGGACRGELLDALVDRFQPDSTLPRPDSVATDTLGGVASDLAAAVQATQRTERRRAASESGSYVGGAATLRLTGHGEGEFRPFWDAVKPIEDGTPPAVGILRVRGTADGGDRLVGVIEAYGETNRRNDPLVRGRRLRRTSGVVDFSDAYVNGQLGRLVLSLGRAREAWLGDAEESVVLSAHGPPLDRLLATAAWRRVEARAIVASLDDVMLTEEQDSLVAGTPPTRMYRFLIGHALAIRPLRSLEVTVGETAILTRPTRLLELSYLNPTMVYMVTQNDSGRLARERDNLAVFGGARWQLGGGVAVTGELFLDDFQLDKGDREITPDQLAWRLAGSAPLPLVKPTTIGVEYRHADNYAYLRGVYSEVFQHYGRPLGTELGPGADLLQGNAEVWLNPTARLVGRLGWWRQGALRIDQRPGQRATGHAGDPFPATSFERPRVQRGLVGGIDFDFLSLSFPLSLRLDLAQIDNAANQITPSALYVRAQLVGTYAFRYP